MSVTLMSPSAADKLLFKTHFSSIRSIDPGARIIWSRARDAAIGRRARDRITHTNLGMPVGVDDKVKFARLMRGSEFVPAGYAPASGKMYVVKPRREANSVGIRFSSSPELSTTCDVQEFVEDVRTFRGKKCVARLLYLWVPKCTWKMSKNGPLVLANEAYSPSDFRPEVQLPQNFVHDASALDIMCAEDCAQLERLGADLFRRLETLNVEQRMSRRRFDIYGLDILFTQGGPLMLEANTYFSLDWDDSTHLIVDAMQELFDELARLDLDPSHPKVAHACTRKNVRSAFQ